MGEQKEKIKKKALYKELKPWQKKRLFIHATIIAIVAVTFLSVTLSTLVSDRDGEDTYWNDSLTMDQKTKKHVEEISTNATVVTAGTYIDYVKELNIKSSNYRLEFLVWFNWESDTIKDMSNHFRVYKGTMNKKEIVKELHQGSSHYQLVRCDVTVAKSFWTRRFPLESHQLRMYLESTIPADQVVFKADKENSGINGSLTISGYELVRTDVADYAYFYDQSHGDPEHVGSVTTPELVTAIEINREGFGVYIKCFIALFGTTTWVLITLFLSTYHRVDPLSMIPAALFGTVSNIMVGANLLPDALQLGLLEYVNVWGVLTIIAVAVSIININRIRNKHEDMLFANLYGSVMFKLILTLVIIGHVLYPLCSYMN